MIITKNQNWFCIDIHIWIFDRNLFFLDLTNLYTCLLFFFLNGLINFFHRFWSSDLLSDFVDLQFLDLEFMLAVIEMVAGFIRIEIKFRWALVIRQGCVGLPELAVTEQDVEGTSEVYLLIIVFYFIFFLQYLELSELVVLQRENEW